MGNLFEQKYPNNIRTISGLNNIPYQDDVVIECDTSAGAVSINLLDIPVNGGAGFWSTQYKLYIVDKSNNAGTNNITVNAPLGTKINGGSSFLISSNGASLLVRVASNNNYVGQYSSGLGGGITALTVTDSPTIDLTLTPILGGFNLKADVTIMDFMSAVKNMTNHNTSYCKKTNQLGALKKYENPFQSITDGAIFQAFDTVNENGGLVGSFNMATGTFTVPTTGFYYIQSQLGYAMNESDQYSFVSDNPNTVGQAWVNNPTDAGSVSITNYLVGSGLASVALKTVSQFSNSLFLYSNFVLKLNAGNQIRVVYTNNSDLEMFGQNNSNLIFRATRLSN